MPSEYKPLLLLNLVGTETAYTLTDDSFYRNVWGNARDNQIFGNAYDNVLSGDAGADTMTGGAGNDIYVIEQWTTGGGPGSDIVVEEENGGIDTVYASIGVILADNVENLVLKGPGIMDAIGNDLGNFIQGNNQINRLEGKDGNDTILGLGGNDWLNGGEGDDTLNGGAGHDIAYFSGTKNDYEFTQVRPGVWTVTDMRAGSPDGTDTVIDVEVLSFNNQLHQLHDGDINRGSVGETVAAGLYEHPELNLLVLSEGRPSKNHGLANGSVYNNLWGNSADNVLTGNASANMLRGRAGADTLDGGAGADYMEGEADNDAYYVDNSGDQVVETALGGAADSVNAFISYSLGAYVENLHAMGSASLSLTGNSLDNAIYGNSGANVLNGGSGRDYLSGGSGSDRYYVDNAGDRVVEASSGGTADRIYTTVDYKLPSHVERLYASGAFSIDLTGNTRDNRLYGNSGSNELYASSGKDKVYGNSGNDKLWGGKGNDYLKGGSGRDTFVFDTKLYSAKTNKKKNLDKVADFSSKYDTLWLDNKYFKKIGSGSERKPKKLKEKYFELGTEADDRNDHLIYDKKKGKLYYDADGSGSKDAVQFAQFKKGTILKYSDFYLI
ncbi:calcium-binding protein [Microvirga roseola]|uniref:calcium-binding protein n=1 Tax=Microvirga roseola TaxID=2883126 RepID=UPI001E35FEAC|nr:calcium-binding protein [Microvirga roseola]